MRLVSGQLTEMASTELEQIEQREKIEELDEGITMEELEEHLEKHQNAKAPGESKVTAEPLKCLTADRKQLVFCNLLNQFMRNEVDPEEWHSVILKCLFKKGDSSNPSNWRGICLKDTAAPVLSSIFNTRLIKVLQKHGIETQYSAEPGRGCLDGLFVLWSTLETRRYHNKATWALFTIDLVKAYDSTVNHDLLFALLDRYGVSAQ